MAEAASSVLHAMGRLRAALIQRVGAGRILLLLPLLQALFTRRSDGRPIITLTMSYLYGLRR